MHKANNLNQTALQVSYIQNEFYFLGGEKLYNVSNRNYLFILLQALSY